MSCPSNEGEATCVTPFTFAIVISVIIVASGVGRGRCDLRAAILAGGNIIPFFLSISIDNPILFSNSVELSPVVRLVW